MTFAALKDYWNGFWNLRNFSDLMNFRRFGKKATIITKKGNTLELPPLTMSDVFSLLKAEDIIKVKFPRAEVSYGGKVLEFFVGLPDAVNVLYETFKKEDYKSDVSGRTVIDVGGFIGDTALYYHLNGAEKVIAVEAHPRNFEVMKRNIKANISDLSRIETIHAAVGAGDAVLFPAETRGGSTSSDSANDSSKAEKPDVVEVPGITIDELAEGHENVLLKMDGEGCEFEALDYSSLDNISEIIMEYHCNMLDCRTGLAETLKKKGFGLASQTANKLPDGRVIGMMRFVR